MERTLASRAHGRRRILVLALAVALLTAVAAQVPADAANPPNYVSLGDSYTAGPVIPVQIPPYGCLKSDHNYPHLATPRLPVASLRDPSCSGAETDDMWNPQDVDPDGPNPPQLDSLDADTQIASLQIGGNDIGFSEIAENCASDSPNGHPCQDRYLVNGDDEIHDRIVATAPKVAAVLQGIHDRAPNAGVYVVNYLPIFPETGDGCWPQVPIARGDVPYLRDKQHELNQMLADQASANGATLVDAYSVGIGHDACQLPIVRWVEPAVPSSPAAPLHPNLAGMQGTADALVATAAP
jgi:lysophospholipase L1-like esterase